jgi:hypothetical protein
LALGKQKSWDGQAQTSDEIRVRMQFHHHAIHVMDSSGAERMRKRAYPRVKGELIRDYTLCDTWPFNVRVKCAIICS